MFHLVAQAQSAPKRLGHGESIIWLGMALEWISITWNRCSRPVADNSPTFITEPRALISFQTIRARAEKRKGGVEALARLLPPKPDPKALRKLHSDRVLAEMTKRVFSAGFAWSVIETKWPGFEEAFLGLPSRLSAENDEFWHRLTMDARIVRNGAKIASVRDNARFVP